MTSDLFFLIVVSAILVAAAGWDLATYTIPNFFPLALFGAFVVFIVVTKMQAPAIGVHALAGLAGFSLGFALFAFGLIGGGDAKLFAVIVLWPSLQDLFVYALVTAVFGGALAIALVGLRTFPLPARLLGHAWLTRLLDPRAGMPYGVALAGGMLALPFLPHTEIFSRAAV